MECVFKLPGTNCQIVIVNGNILQQEGVKIIHGPRTFDTHSDIVPQQTVFGQFVAYCEEHEVELDSQIDKWCQCIVARGELKEDYRHRKIRFSEGELCPVQIGQEIACIAAFSYTESVLVADNIVLGQYLSYWQNIWKNLQRLSIDKSVVNVAVPGTRLVSIGPSSFGYEQNIAIILYSFFKSITDTNKCKTLRLCLYGSAADDFDFEGWMSHIIPFLYSQSILPLEWTPSEKPSPKRDKSLTLDECAFNSFIDDFSQMIENIETFNGRDFVQFEGSKKVQIKVHIDGAGLRQVIEAIKSTPDVSLYLTKRKGIKYDRNRMFQLLGIIQECSTLFGELNRRSVVMMCLESEDVVPARWNHLGDNIGNIINYVGQKLADIKKNNPIIFDKIVDIIPKDKRKKQYK